MDFSSNSKEATVGFGRSLGFVLRPNDVVALVGPLGAGKTTLVQGIAEGLGVKDYVTSPTFILINEYQGRLPLFHADLYRLGDAADIEDLGIEEYFDRGGVCVIEWAEKLMNIKPKNLETIEIKIKSENERELCLSSALAARLK